MNFKKCIFLVILLIGTFFGIKGVNAATLNYDYSGYYYSRVMEGSNSSFYWNLYYLDGDVSYCIETDVFEGEPLYEANFESTGLNSSIKERLLLISYYGYTYPNHNTLEFRAATQGMIWETILNNTVVVGFSTGRWSTGENLDISKEKTEIESLIRHHYDKPSFDGKSYTAQVGEEIILVDENNVIENFDINVSGADYKVEGDILKLTPTESGEIEVNFIKKTPYKEDYKIYIGDGVQNMIKPGNVAPVVSNIKINSYYGYIEGTKKDIETINPQGDATLKGAEYGIYEKSTGKLITTVITDENGYFKSEKVLPYNDYYLKEIKPSKGYLLDNRIYNFSLKQKDKIIVNVNEKVIKNYISILKQYEAVDGNSTFLNAESGIIFEIYDSKGNLYNTITTDKNGYASIEIPYGTYKLHQVNASYGFEKIYDFYIIVDETSQKEQYYNILNNALSAYLQVVKIDEETGENIAISNTTFKILNTDTNQYVSQYVAGKVYSEFKTDENGVFVTYLKLEAGNYKLIEVISPNGYLLDSDGLEFTIGENTHYSYTSYGTFITLYFKNKPIKGQVEIHKTGEDFTIEDGEYTYTSKHLNSVKFEIYADEDILSPDGNYLYYSKGDLVDTVITDKTGYAISKKLPLGKYYIIEVETGADYILNNQKYFFELESINDKTPMVYTSYSNLNLLKKGTLEFTKTDLVSGDVIPNTKVEIYTENGELIYTGITDKDGKIVINDLKVGKYYIVESKPENGYVMTDECVYFEILEDGEIVKANMKNKPITGTLEFTKIDLITGKTLPNALIEIYNENDELVFSGTTDEFGRIIVSGLRYGKYYIVESESPNGYALNQDKIYFEIKYDNEIVKKSMADEKIIIEVPNTLKNNYFKNIKFIILFIGILITCYSGYKIYENKI